MVNYDITERLRELGIYSQYYYRLELKPLSRFLNVDEKLNCVLTGVIDGRRRLVAITDFRILLIASGAITSGEILIIRRDAVTSWSFNKKFLLSSAVIETKDKTYQIKQTQAGIQKLFTWAMEQEIKQYDK